MRIIFVILFISLHQSSIGQVKSGEMFINEFLLEMKNYGNLNDYIFGIESFEKNKVMINFYNIEEYEIKKLSDLEYQVLIDTGKGSKCIQINILLIKTESGLYKIKPGEVIFNEMFNKNIIDPWISKKKIC